LDYFLARYYSSAQGRFTSADAFGGSLVNPQTLNLYSYVQGNPPRYVDPSGHFAADDSELRNAFGLKDDHSGDDWVHPFKGLKQDPGSKSARTSDVPEGIYYEADDYRPITTLTTRPGFFSRLWGGIKSVGGELARFWPRTRGMTSGVSGSGGLGIFGAALDINLMTGRYANYKTLTEGVGWAMGGGGFFGGSDPNEGFGVPYGTKNPGGQVLGAYAGLGYGAFFSNVTDFNGFSGDFDTYQINTPAGGAQLDLSGRNYVLSFTLGPGIGASLTHFRTTTPQSLIVQTPPVLPLGSLPASKIGHVPIP
jgi:hypothetical protein